MPRFHLHIYDRAGSARDEEGLELTDLDEARASAVDGIRSLASQEVRVGLLDLEGRVEIADEGGTVLGIVRFPEAVEIRPPAEGSGR
jgi:hypothetical protein